MHPQSLVSIIINNYNYGRFLKEAINSAINQSYANVEVIVVDDGSTDGSIEIINEYVACIIPVLKENGGQASALNAGFKISNGEIIIFLDSDDILLPTAAGKVVESFNCSNTPVSKLHWNLWEVNEKGEKNRRRFPDAALPQGNLRDIMIQNGPTGYLSAPTSGNAWSRKFLDKVMPIPEEIFRISADSYLFMLAPLFGLIQTVPEPQALYRVHGNNNFKGKILKEQTLKSTLTAYDHSCDILKKFFNTIGMSGDTKNWKHNSWFYKLLHSMNDIKNLIPENKTLILADQDQWEAAGEVAGRKVLPFVQQNGEYWGPPADDECGIAEIERQRKNGAAFIVFAWPAFWFLDYYSSMHSYLESSFSLILKNDQLIIFNLQ